MLSDWTPSYSEMGLLLSMSASFIRRFSSVLAILFFAVFVISCSDFKGNQTPQRKTDGDQKRQFLSTSELRDFYSDGVRLRSKQIDLTVDYESDGTVHGKKDGNNYEGRWRIKNDRLCEEYPRTEKWDRCYRVNRDGSLLYYHDQGKVLSWSILK